jgi:chromosome segregation ATPase
LPKEIPESELNRKEGRMHRVISFAISLLLLAVGSACQTTTGDSKTLQDLLVEVRQLRQDLHTSIGAVERAQILVHRVEVEEYAVRGMRERVDNARSNLGQIQSHQRVLADRIKQLQNTLDSSDTSQVERKPLEQALAQSKQSYESQANDEQEAQAKLTEFEDELRLEQAKLSELEGQLERLDRDLENASRDRK